MGPKSENSAAVNILVIHNYYVLGLYNTNKDSKKRITILFNAGMVSLSQEVGCRRHSSSSAEPH